MKNKIYLLFPIIFTLVFLGVASSAFTMYEIGFWDVLGWFAWFVSFTIFDITTQKMVQSDSSLKLNYFNLISLLMISFILLYYLNLAIIY